MTTIYCDLDGVIANFVEGAIEVADLPLTHDQVTQWDFFKLYMSSEEFWARVHAQSCFWEDLPVYPWAHELVEALRAFGEVVFCSDPTLDDESATGKIRWLKRHGFMKPNGKNLILTPNKWMLARPTRALVDDYVGHLIPFAHHGGEAIMFPQRWNDTCGNATVDPVGVVVGRLKRFTGLGGAL